VPLSGGDIALAVVAAFLLCPIGMILASGGRVDLAGTSYHTAGARVALRRLASVGM
jgi:hypothetical protein